MVMLCERIAIKLHAKRCVQIVLMFHHAATWNSSLPLSRRRHRCGDAVRAAAFSNLISLEFFLSYARWVFRGKPAQMEFPWNFSTLVHLFWSKPTNYSIDVAVDEMTVLCAASIRPIYSGGIFFFMPFVALPCHRTKCPFSLRVALRV